MSRSQTLAVLALVVLANIVEVESAVGAGRVALGTSRKQGGESVQPYAVPIGSGDAGWGFQENGKIDVHVWAEQFDLPQIGNEVPSCGSNVTLKHLAFALAVVMRGNQWTRLKSEGFHENTLLCTQPALSRTHIDVSAPMSTRRVQMNRTKEDQLVVVITLCSPGVGAVVGYNYSFTNPSGDASLETIPLQGVYLGFTNIYAILFLFSTVYLLYVYARHKTAPNGIQLTMVLSMLAKTVELIVFLVASDASTLASFAVMTVSECTWLWAQFLMAAGWTICRKQLPRRERNIAWVLLLVFLVAGLGDAVCKDDEDDCSTSFESTVRFIQQFARVLLLLWCGYMMSSTYEGLRTKMSKSDSADATVHFLKYRALRFPYFVSLPVPLFVYFLESAVLTWRSAYIARIFYDLTIVYVYLLAIVFFRKNLVIG